MTYLLDTHIWLWWQMRPKRLLPDVRERIADPANTVLFSTVSTWELAIKSALGRLVLPEPLERMVPDCLEADRMQTLVLQHRHGFELAALPRHHRDPFDRMLIAQARAERCTIITADPAFRVYDVEILPAG